MAPLAAQDSLRALLPDEVLIAAEIGDPATGVRGILTALGPVPANLPEDVRALVGFGLTALRVALGGSLEEVLADVASGGAVAGVLPHEGRVLALAVARTGNAEAARRRLDHLVGADRVRILGDLVLVASRAEGLDLLEARNGGTPGRWARWPDTGAVMDGAIARLWIDVAGIRGVSRGARTLLSRLDPGGRFFLGPAASLLDDTERVAVSLTAGTDGITLRAEVDGVVALPFRDLLAADLGDRTIPAAPPGTGLVLSLDRSLRALLAEPARFLGEQGVVGVSGFLTIADQLDGTTSFVDDLLGGLGEPIHFYLRMPEAVPPAEELPLLFPEFAFVARVMAPEVRPILNRTAQLFSLIVNAERAQQNKFPFVMRTLRTDGAVGLSAEPAEWRGPGAPPAEHALSPTLMFAEDHVVLASTRGMADAMSTALGSGARQALAGDVVQVMGAPIARWLARNRGVIEVARMLDEGETLAESRRFFGIVEAVAAALDRLELRFAEAAGRTVFELRLRRAAP